MVLGDYGDFRVVFIYVYKIVSEYVKSILAGMENKLKEYKRIWRIRKGYLVVYGEYSNWHKI